MAGHDVFKLIMIETTITIDGPAASGKTTVGYQLAEKLGYVFLDTGVMYRAVTLVTLNRDIDPNNEAAVVEIANNLQFDISPEVDHPDGRHYTVLVNGEDATWQIRSPGVNENVSVVSSYPAVRAEMVRLQREFAAGHAVVMVGRDIGTVVLPNAPLKFYMDATAEIRALRRLSDHLVRNYNSVEFEKILADIERRDAIDSSRAHSPLKPAEDAVVIDTSQLTPNGVLEKMIESVEERGLPDLAA